MHVAGSAGHASQMMQYDPYGAKQQTKKTNPSRNKPASTTTACNLPLSDHQFKNPDDKSYQVKNNK